MNYQTDGAGQFSVSFASSSDTLLVMEADDRFRGEFRFVAPGGESIAAGSLDGYALVPDGAFVLVEPHRMALKRIGNDGPPRYDIVPEGPLTDVGASFLSWIRAAGGLMDDRTGFSASTNAYADVSCAVGADGSIAVWRVGEEGSFRVSAPGAVTSRALLLNGVFCLSVQGRLYAALVGVDESASPSQRSIALVFEAGESEPAARLVLVADETPIALGAARTTSADEIAGIGQLLDANLSPNQRQRVVARIRFQDGAWRAAQAELSGNWPRDVRWYGLGRDQLLVSAAQYPLEVLRVRWPEEATTLPFEPTRIRVPAEDFYRDTLINNTPVLSPSGRRILWVDRRGEFRIEDAGREYATW